MRRLKGITRYSQDSACLDRFACTFRTLEETTSIRLGCCVQLWLLTENHHWISLAITGSRQSHVCMWARHKILEINRASHKGKGGQLTQRMPTRTHSDRKEKYVISKKLYRPLVCCGSCPPASTHNIQSKPTRL